MALDERERAVRDAAILETLATAFDALARARAGEGRKLHAVLAAQIDEIDRLTQQAATLAAAQPAALRDKLAAQVKDMLAGGTLAEDRLAQEVALLAVKADIREELDRLRAHLESARELLAAGAGIGRRLDFLAQELGRESNTLCSKANDVSLSRIGLDLKAAVEQFKEQVQNVE